MQSRLAIRCVITALVGLVGVACGDDEGGGEAAGSGGATAGRSGVSGTGAGTSGTPGFGGRGSAGRGGVTTQMCPASEPANGDTCMPARGDCMFGERVCDCIAPANTWACWSPATDCPTTVPAEQSMCPVPGISCELTTGEECDCRATGWDCGNQFCPAAEPTAGGACEEGRGQCTFGTRTCDCNDDVWVCWSPSDCPATPPVERSMCTLVGAVCPFEGGSCECETRGWNCSRGVMQPEPETDAGI